jgi:hypothetical protein
LLVWRRRLTGVGHKAELVTRNIQGIRQKQSLRMIGETGFRFFLEAQLLILQVTTS